MLTFSLVLRLCTPQMCLPVFLEDTWPTWHVLYQLLWRGIFYSKLSLSSPLKAILGECDKGCFLGQWKWLWFWDILVWEITYCNQSPEFSFLECVKTALKMVLEDTHFIFIYLFIYFYLLLLYWLHQCLWLCGSQQTVENSFFLIFFKFYYYYYYFFYCSGFCHTLKWNSHGFPCVPHPDPPSHLPLPLIPLCLPSAPGPSACLMHPTWAGDLFHPR